MNVQAIINVDAFKLSNNYWDETHSVENQPSALKNYNVFDSYLALKEAVLAHDGPGRSGSWLTDHHDIDCHSYS
jgi:hypothetical protein